MARVQGDKLNVIKKVLDFVQLGGRKRRVIVIAGL